jgi:hypothetical protein
MNSSGGEGASRIHTERAVAGLIVRLQEAHEGARRQLRTRLAARPVAPVARPLTLICEALGQATAEMPDRLRYVVGIVAVVLAGSDNVRRVMDIVIPLRGRKSWSVATIADKVARLVAVVLENEVHVAVATRARTDGGGDLAHDVRPRIIDDGMHRVEAQAVEAVLIEPEQRVLDEEVADDP